MTSNLKNAVTAVAACLVISIIGISFRPSFGTTVSKNEKHLIDSKFVGKWMWTKGSSGAYYDDNGIYKGAAYGFAIQYKINADGTGTCFNHVSSRMGVGVALTVDISYKGFFESDDQGHLGFFPTGGRYVSTSGTDRALRPDELWDEKKNNGRSFIYQKVEVTKKNEKNCFEITNSDGSVDTFFKID